MELQHKIHGRHWAAHWLLDSKFKLGAFFALALGPLFELGFCVADLWRIFFEHSFTMRLTFRRLAEFGR